MKLEKIRCNSELKKYRNKLFDYARGLLLGAGDAASEDRLADAVHPREHRRFLTGFDTRLPEASEDRSRSPPSPSRRRAPLDT